MNQIALSRRHMLRGAAMFSAGLALPRAALAQDGAEAHWPGVTALLDRYVGEKKVSGALATLGWGNNPLGYIARGKEGFDDADAVGTQSLFRLYSMTKPVTGMAAMMLIEEGKLGLDQPLADFVPEFANMKVAVDPAAGLDAVPAKSQITVRQLLTHTSGLGYAGISRNKVGDELVRLGVVPARITHLRLPGVATGEGTPEPGEFLRRAASVPLQFEPGTKWRYSMGLDVLGLVIERATGEKFADVLRARLFGPAGMNDSWFQVPAVAESRLTTNYGVLGGMPLPIDKPGNSVFEEQSAFAFGGAGLVSTPADYDRFLQMLVDGGKVGGKRVMSEKAVALGMSNLMGEHIDTRGTMLEGAGFGAGGRVGLGADAGSFGWSGAAGTVGFVQARVGLRAGLYVQFMPPEIYPMQKEFIAATRDDARAQFK